MKAVDTVENKTFDEIEIGMQAELSRTLTSDEIAKFAIVSGDINPTHLDDKFAEQTPAGRVVAHSMWGGALISSVLGTILPGPGTVYVRQTLNFIHAAHRDETITARVQVREKNAANQTILLHCLCVNEAGETILEGEAEVRAPAAKHAIDVSELPQLQIQRRNHFARSIELTRAIPAIRTAVAHPCAASALEAVVDAAEEEIITPILVGPRHKIERIAAEHELDICGFELIDAPHSHAAAEQAVSLVRAGRADLLMKGSLHTDELLGPIVNKTTGLRTERRISHVFIMDVATYPRLLFITDAAVNIFPDLMTKADIVQNAIDLAQALGNERPKVAIVSAVETVNPKIPSTIDAAALCKMAERGQITGGLLDGPLALDNAISLEAARVKEITSEVAGCADVLLAPDLEAGNMLAKNLSFLANADAAGILLGARVPVVLTSRADKLRAKLASCAVAAIYAHALKQPKAPAE
ncbi:MAG: bifunctional enoyl-CoA hydratase/phosphate acetyltransferase [Pseudomonadota bacterium]